MPHAPARRGITSRDAERAGQTAAGPVRLARLGSDLADPLATGGYGYTQYSVPPPAATAPVVPAFTYCHRHSGLPPTQ
jgi:hypothetical protein